MQSRLLQNFLTVAECASITEAATVLNVSQPALTKSIRKLEVDLGVNLFDRWPTGISLTSYGEVLLRHVKLMENEYRHALAGIDELKSGSAGALRIGAGPVWLVAILPDVITQFQKQYPDVKVSLTGGVSGSLLPDLLKGNLDIVFSAFAPQNRSEIENHALISIRNVLLSDPLHPLASGTKIEGADLQGYPWMMLQGDPIARERVNAFYASQGMSPPSVALETTSIFSLLQSLKGSNGVANVPEQMLPLAMSLGLAKLDMRDTFWETSAGYSVRRSVRSSSALGKFVDATKAYLAAKEVQT